MRPDDGWDKVIVNMYQQDTSCSNDKAMPDEAYFFNAAMARAIANEAKALDGSYKRKETLDLLGKIKSAAARGESSFLASILDQVIIGRLLALGYKVKNNSSSGSSKDDSTTISWD